METALASLRRSAGIRAIHGLEGFAQGILHQLPGLLGRLVRSQVGEHMVAAFKHSLAHRHAGLA
ncbi:hypothetical protein D3C80_2089120 [compost metagenome]